MKRIIAVLVFCLTFFTLSQGFAKEKPRLGVLRFTNNTRAAWWSGTAGRDMQDMLAAELVTLKAFRVLERKELEALYIRFKTGELVEESYEEKKTLQAKKLTTMTTVEEIIGKMIK